MSEIIDISERSSDLLEPIFLCYNLAMRCCLCSFDLMKGDQFIALTESGFSCEFTDSGKEVYQDHMHSVTFFTERSGGAHLKKALACHVGCNALQDAVQVRRLLEQTEFAFTPPPAGVERRLRWLHSNLESTLYITLQPFSVPREMCDEIAGHCVRAHAVGIARAFWRPWQSFEGYVASHQHEFRLSAEVWARYTEFEGVRYITSLRNEPGEDGHAARVHRPGPGIEVDTLYLSEDHLGVRKILFFRSPSVPKVEKRPGIWWTAVDVPTTKVFQVRTDGIKIRSLRHKTSGDPTNSPDSLRLSAFEVPTPPTKRLRRYKVFLHQADRLRMTSIVLNDPRTTGYSVCHTSHPVSLHAHVAGEDCSFYDRQRYGVWLYMPVEEDERISGMWIRYSSRDLGAEPSLVFRTNKGQVKLMGPGPMKAWEASDYLPLMVSPSGRSRLYFDDSLFKIHEYALQGEMDGSEVQDPTLPRPESARLVKYSLDDDYFFSFARLEGVTEVTPCRSDVVEFGPAIIGLLFRYASGRQAAVGQVRVDRLEAPFKVGPSQELRLDFSVPSDCRPNVKSIINREDERARDDVAPPVYFDIPMRGRLEWWFSDRQCMVYHGGRSSPKMRPL